MSGHSRLTPPLPSQTPSHPARSALRFSRAQWPQTAPEPPGASLLAGPEAPIDQLRAPDAAARAAGIDEYRASRISDYDFRHSRLTHLGQVSDNLSGVMFLAGHKQPATTARYLRPQKQAEVLHAAAAREFRSHSGRTGESEEAKPARSTGGKPKNFERSARTGT